MEFTKVLVAMPIIDREQSLTGALTAMATQTANYIMVAIDGGSTDETVDKLVAAAKAVNNIGIMTAESGISNCLNKLMGKANAEYLTFMMSDDLCSANKIEIQSAFLDENPDVDVVSCATLMPGKSALAPTINMLSHDDIVSLLSEGYNLDEVCNENTVMIRMSAIKKLFDEDNTNYFLTEFNLGHAIDALLYYMYANGAKFANINSTSYLYNYELEDNSLSRNNPDRFYDVEFKDLSLEDKCKKIIELYNNSNGEKE